MGTVLAVALALLGTPLFVVVAVLALLSFGLAGIDLTVVLIEMYRIAETPTLSAIPLFGLSGFLLAESGAADRLVRFSRVILGWLPGGLAIMALLLCALFTAFTGASGMTIIAIGGLLYPALVQARYPPRFALGLVTTSGSLGLLFPPSLPLILYGIVAAVPIGQLFLAGLLPGSLLIGGLALYGAITGRRHEGPAFPPPTTKDIIIVWRECIWELLMPIAVLSAIFGGFIAVSEAAALSVLYIGFVEMVVRREIRPRQLLSIVRQSMTLFGAILVILATSMAYTNYLVDAEVPARLLDYVRRHIEDPFTFLISLNLFLLMVGCMMDIFSALIVVMPLILPLAQSYGIHPVHLGIIFLTNLEIGYSTPPVGMNLFISGLRFDQPLLQLYRASLPFLAILLVLLALITYVPSLSLWFIAP